MCMGFLLQSILQRRATVVVVSNSATCVANYYATCLHTQSTTTSSLYVPRPQRDLLRRNVGVIRDTEAKIGEELERLGRVVREEKGAGEEQLKERTKYRKKLAEVVGEWDGERRRGPGPQGGEVGRPGSAPPWRPAVSLSLLPSQTPQQHTHRPTLPVRC